MTQDSDRLTPTVFGPLAATRPCYVTRAVSAKLISRSGHRTSRNRARCTRARRGAPQLLNKFMETVPKDGPVSFPPVARRALSSSQRLEFPRIESRALCNYGSIS